MPVLTEDTEGADAAPSGAGRPDAACAEAIDLARGAVTEMVGTQVVGDHVGIEVEEDRVATHLFTSHLPGYRGWCWAVTVARVPRGRVVTVAEVVHLPGPEALLAPPWVPWADRLQPGDVGVGDVLPAAEEDVRLEPGWSSALSAGLDEQVAAVARDLGLARRRVLSQEGKDAAADRWLNGAGGPFVPLAEQAPATCDTCGFLVHIGGELGQAFGLCANVFSPSDGHVVSFEHGCGGHSEGSSRSRRRPTSATGPVVDDEDYEDLGHS